VAELLKNALQTLDLGLYALFLLAVSLGLRIGERLVLEWSNLDLDQRVVEVAKSWNYHTGQMGPPKKGKPRKVHLSPVTVETLKNLRKNKNQLYYLLVTSLAVSCSCRVDKAAALTGLAAARIDRVELGATFGTEQGIRVGCCAALGTLVNPKLGSTPFTVNRISIVKRSTRLAFHEVFPSRRKVIPCLSHELVLQTLLRI